MYILKKIYFCFVFRRIIIIIKGKNFVIEVNVILNFVKLLDDLESEVRLNVFKVSY